MNFDWVNFAIDTIGGATAAYCVIKHSNKKQQVVEVKLENSPLPEESPRKPYPNSVVLEVRGHWMDRHVTVSYGKLKDGILVPDFRKIVSIFIPEYVPGTDVPFPEAELANIPMEQIISPLPEMWADYLLSQPEAKM